MSDFLTDARTAGDAKRFQWLLDNGDIGTREEIDKAMEPVWTRTGAIARCQEELAEPEPDYEDAVGRLRMLSNRQGALPRVQGRTTKQADAIEAAIKAAKK